MSESAPLRLALICRPDYDLLPLKRLTRKASDPISLSTVSSPDALDDLPLDKHDVVLLDLSVLRLHGMDASDLSDVLFLQMPVVLLGDVGEGAQALEGLRYGAQDWLIHGHLDERPLENVLRQARVSFSHQRSLIVNHAQYQSVVEDQSEYICRFLPDCTLTFVNQAFAAYLGKDARSLIGTSVLDVLPADIREDYPGTLKALTPEFPLNDRDFSVNVEGDVYWQHWSDKAFFDSNGVMLEIQSVGADITLRRSAEQEARDSQARFRSLYQYAPVMMQELDAAGHVLSVNQLWMDTLGYDASEVIDRHAYRFLDSQSWDIANDNLDDLRYQGKVKNVFCQYIARDGRRIDAIVSASAVLDADHSLARVLIVSLEVSDPHHEDERPVEQREPSSSLFTLVGDAIISADEFRQVKYLNPSAERLTGWALEEARGHRIDEVFHLLDQATRQPALERILSRQCESLSHDARYQGVLVDKAGENHLISSSAIISTPGDGQKSETILVFNEVEATC